MSSIINKVKNAVHSDNHQGAPEGTHGPHSNRAMNAADPRVDSDLDGSRNIGGTQRTAGHGEYGVGQGASEGTHGPHTSRMANAADPRVDSDRDGSRTMGGTGRTAGHGEFGAGQAYTSGGAGTTGTGMTGTGMTGTGMTGTGFGNEYSSAGTGSTGMTGTGGRVPEGTHGPHSNRAMNAADPRFDSDMDGRAAVGNAPGPAPNTAGPHQSDMLNKVDPRVDSDLDNSKTLGGNRTFQ